MSDNICRNLYRLRIEGTLEQRLGAPEIGRRKEHVGRGAEFTEFFVFLHVPPHDEFYTLSQPEMPAHAQEIDIAESKIFLLGEKLFQFHRKNGVRKEAPAAGPAELFEAVFFRKGILAGPSPARDAEEPVPVQHAFDFRNGGGEAPARKGPHYQAFEPAFFLYHADGLPPLGHGPLSDDLAGNDETGADLLHEGLGYLQHIYPAVDAGVHILSVAVPGVLQHFEIIIFLVACNELYAEFGCRLYRPCASLLVTPAGEGGREMKTDHFHALVHHEPGGENAVEPSRYEGYRFSVHAWFRAGYAFPYMDPGDLSSSVCIFIPESTPGRGATGFVRRNCPPATHPFRIVAICTALE